MITFKQKGDFKKLNSFLEKTKEMFNFGILNKYGEIGVSALAAATPRDTGKTAKSWSYSIERNKNSVSVVWSNSNVHEGCNIAIILQYGHGTINGGFVSGREYINEAMRPVFDELAESAWKEVIES